MNIDDTIVTLSARDNWYSVRRIPVTDITSEPESLKVGEVHYRLPDSSFARLCRKLGAPPGYLSQIEPNLRAAVLQFHIERGDLNTDKPSIITRGDDLVAIESSDLHRLKSTDVFQALLEGVETVDLKVHRLQFHEESFQLDLVSEDLSEEVAAEDVLQAGLQLTHSFIGEQATSIQSYVLRLACTNGMTYRDCVAKRATRTRRLSADRPDAHELQMAQVRRLAKDTWGALREKLSAIKALRHEKIEVDHLFQRWIERARLSTRDILPRLQGAWRRGGEGSTAYDAMNALTFVATHDPEIDLRVRRILSGLAGVLAFRQIHFCPRCFTLLRASTNLQPSAN